MDYHHLATSLLKDGYVVFPVGPARGPPPPELLAARQRMLSPRPVRESPLTGISYLARGVCPGSGLSPFPSTVHCPETRALRASLSLVNRGLSEALVACGLLEGGGLPGGPVYFAELLERWLCRDRGVAPSSEQPHRDVTADVLSPLRDLRVFGGFVNVNVEEGEDQHFRCCPGTHCADPRAAGDTGLGFSKLSAEEVRRFKGQMRVVAVPPRHRIVFFENIVHEIRTVKYKYRILRLFTAFQVWTGAPPCSGGACNAPYEAKMRGFPKVNECHLCRQRGMIERRTLEFVKGPCRVLAFPQSYTVWHRAKVEAIVRDQPQLVVDGKVLTQHPPARYEENRYAPCDERIMFGTVLAARGSAAAGPSGG